MSYYNLNRFANYIYKRMFAYEPVLEYIDRDDVLQEIRIAILVAKPGELFKIARKLIYNLTKDYGFSKKMGKDNFHRFYQETIFTEKEYAVLDTIEQLYQNENRTAREVAEIFDVEYTNSWQKLLCEAFPKQMRGGTRKNAGRKKQKNEI